MTITKSELMSRVNAGAEHECFEHSEEGIFDVTLMRMWAMAHLKPVLVPLEDMVPFILSTRDTEPARVFELPEDSWRHDPGLAVEYPGDPPQHLMIDGHHRALRRAAEGLKDMPMFIIPQAGIIRPRPGWGINPFTDWGGKVMKDGKLVDRE